MSDLMNLTARAARDALRGGEISAVDLTEAYLAAAEATSALNAYIAITPDKALEMARESDQRLKAGEGGILEGLPIGVKDMFCVKGVETTAALQNLKRVCSTL